MNCLKPTSAALPLLLLFAARDHASNATVAPDRRVTSRLEVQAVSGQSYRTRDGRSAITFVSSQELEYRVHDGTIFLCKYSKQQDGIRVILTVLGTQQVLYFRRAPNGFTSKDGTVYLSPSAFAEAQREEESSRLSQQKAYAVAEQQRVERDRLATIAAQRQAEEQRLADERARREAPENLRALLMTHPELNGSARTGAFTLRIVSFDSATGSVSGEVDFNHGGITGVVYDPPLAKSRDGHSSRAVGNVSRDTITLTATWTQKDWQGEVAKGLVRLKLHYDGTARRLTGPWYWGDEGRDMGAISFKLP